MKFWHKCAAAGVFGALVLGSVATTNSQPQSDALSSSQQQATTIAGYRQATATAQAQQATATAQAQQATAQAQKPPPANSRLVLDNQLTPGPGQRLVVFVNNLQQTIWIESLTSFGGPLTTTFWKLLAGHGVDALVPDHWDGRFWGDTDCTNFDSKGQPTGCATGHCPPGTNCESGAPSFATLAEFNLQYPGANDYYDISLVDGYNLPMYINSIGGSPDTISSNGCLSAPLSPGGPTGCTTDANALCANSLYSQLQVQDPAGNVIACKSACTLFEGEGHSPDDATADPYCCPGGTLHGTTQTCQPDTWPSDLGSNKIFKQAEPFAYSYTYDDATSTLACAGSCGYRITFGTSS